MITADILQVRSGPGSSFSVIHQLQKGQKVGVIDRQGKWLFIQTTHYQGWIYEAYVKEIDFYTLTPQQQIDLSPGTFIIPSGASPYLQNKTIILDAGHGGKDKGATGTQGTYEKDLTLRTVLLLKTKLEQAGARVILTRKKDTYLHLSDRTLPSKSADAFISVHYNSVENKDLTGLMTYFYYKKQDSALTNAIHHSLVHHAKLQDKGQRFGDYYVLRENNRPSTLIELGFLSNKREEKYINSVTYQQSITTSIVRGLSNYFARH
ncbi:N-acetylmuramoyl-L-alanine amidase [Priestia megaterium]|nr:N-acetylmuramoyl-L-alanine amidase [Priestia megaterium]